MFFFNTNRKMSISDDILELYGETAGLYKSLSRVWESLSIAPPAPAEAKWRRVVASAMHADAAVERRKRVAFDCLFDYYKVSASWKHLKKRTWVVVKE